MRPAYTVRDRLVDTLKSAETSNLHLEVLNKNRRDFAYLIIIKDSHNFFARFYVQLLAKILVKKARKELDWGVSIDW